MDIDIYLDPIELAGYEFADKTSRLRLGDVVTAYNKGSSFPDLSDVNIAILGVLEDRNAISNNGCASAPDQVRKYLYRLFEGAYKTKLVDLGNIKSGHSIEDTYFAMSSVVKELLKQNIVPIIIGGGQDLTYANYQAYEDLGQIINIVAIDPLFDLGKTENEMSSQSYLSKIILHQPNYLFNFSNIGYQTYFVDQEAIELMKNLFFDAYRLGTVRAKIEEVEPIVRNADLVSFDVSAIRHSDAPGNKNVSPNGFYGEEACQIARYAGMSDKLTSIGFYEMNPEYDQHGQTAHLVSQMIWYFIDGYYNRKHEFPHKDKRLFIKYHVAIEGEKDEMVFYKSKKSDRWWMEVPIRSQQKVKFKRHHMIPCSYQDYQTACDNDVPDRWWQAYQKLM
jgi:formiminoglutamase